MPNGDWTPPKPIQPAPMASENQEEAPLVETLRATAEVVGRPRSVMLNKAADEIERLSALDAQALAVAIADAQMVMREEHAKLCDRAVADFVQPDAADPFSQGFRSACALLKRAFERPNVRAKRLDTAQETGEGP